MLLVLIMFLTNTRETQTKVINKIHNTEHTKRRYTTQHTLYQLHIQLFSGKKDVTACKRKKGLYSVMRSINTVYALNMVFITSRSPDKILILVVLCYKADLPKRTTKCIRFKVGIGMVPNVCTMWKQRTIVPTEQRVYDVGF